MKEGSEANCVTCNKCPIGVYASKKWQAEISQRKFHNWYLKGQYIFYQGNPVHGMFLLREGKVKIVTQVSNNGEQIVRLTRGGHILGRQGKKKDIYANSAVAMDDSEVCFINSADIEELLLNNAELTFKLMGYYSGELRKAEKRIKILAQLSVREKIAETILYIQSVFESDKEGFINTTIGRKEIADICGASPEHVSREVSLLVKQGVITSSHKQIKILDQEALALIGNQRT